MVCYVIQYAEILLSYKYSCNKRDPQIIFLCRLPALACLIFGTEHQYGQLYRVTQF